MKEDLESGTTLIVDRYSFSGVAFTAAKVEVWGAGTAVTRAGARPRVVQAARGWTDRSGRRPPPRRRPLSRSAAVGLPAAVADLVTLVRGGFGGERYERTEFQEKVRHQFALLRDDTWKVAMGGRCR